MFEEAETGNRGSGPGEEEEETQEKVQHTISAEARALLMERSRCEYTPASTRTLYTDKS